MTYKLRVFAVLAPFVSASFPIAICHAENIYFSVADSVGVVSSEGKVTTYATGFNDPQGIALDKMGNLFVANQGNDSISEVTPGGKVTTFANTLLNKPTGLAFDAQGNLYVSNYNYQGAYADTIVKFTPDGAGSVFTTVGTNLSGLTFDSKGNLYVSALSQAVIYKVTPDGSSSLFTHTFSSSTGLYVIPYGLAADANDTIFVDAYSYRGSEVEQYPFDWDSAVLTDDKTQFATGLSGAGGIVFDGEGNLYTVDDNSESVIEFSPSGGIVRTLPTKLGLPKFLAVQAPEPSVLELAGMSFLILLLAKNLRQKSISKIGASALMGQALEGF